MISLFNRFRSFLFSPNSRVELWLRTIYHKLNATRLLFRLHHIAALRSYQKWRSTQIKKAIPLLSEFENQPKVTFILGFPADDTEKVISTLKSLRDLKGNNWEVLLITRETGFNMKLPDDFSKDPHIKIISKNQRKCLHSISGEYLVFCQPGDRFYRSLLVHFYKKLTKGNSADIYYFDCEYQKDQSKDPYPLFKPSKYSPSMLLSINYLSRSFINLKAAQEVLSEIDTQKSLVSQEYDLIFRLCEMEKSFRHIPYVLISQEDLPKPDNLETQEMVTAHLSRLGLEDIELSETISGPQFTWSPHNPETAIIIPTKNNRPLLETLVDSIFEHTHNIDFSIHIVDNGSDDASTLNYYKTISQNPIISIIDYNKPFNYSEAINLGVSNSSSDLVLLLNDDMQIITDSWLRELAQWAIRPEIGVVGAKLLRANQTIQHAGIIIGLNGFAGHIYLNAPDHYQGMFGSTDWYRDYLAVTGACQMMRREVFIDAGGYDEGYRLAFGDIDFCLRVNQLGYRNVYTPFTSIYHYEGKTRGYLTPTEDVLKGLEDMKTYLETGDPNFSPNLTYTRIPKCAQKKQSQQTRAEQIEIRKQFYLRK